MTLHQGYRAHKACNCSDDGHNRQELNCDDTIVRTENASTPHQVSVASLHSYKCVIARRQELEPFFINRRYVTHHRLRVIILNNLLVDSMARDRVMANQNLLVSTDDSPRLFINLETLNDLSFYGYQRSIISQKQSRNIKSELEALVGQEVPFIYSNTAGFENPTIMAISDVFVGVVVYDMMLVEQGVFTALQLHHWILKESACLHNKGSDVVIVVGNGDALFNQMIDVNYKLHYKSPDQSHKLLVVGINPAATDASSKPIASEYTDVVMIHTEDMLRIDLNITRTHNRIIFTHESTSSSVTI